MDLLKCIYLLFCSVLMYDFKLHVTISNIKAAMSSGSDERHQLRKDLGEAQQKLDALKEMQRQMTVSGIVPAGRVSPRPPSGKNFFFTNLDDGM